MVNRVDVAVIGAGAAGLAAGSALRAAGVSFAVIEARGRIGGRAFTDRTTFPGLHFDAGCHWLHVAATNPLRYAADRLGFAYADDYSFDHARYVIDGRGLTGDEADTFSDSAEDLLERAKSVAPPTEDCAVSEAVVAESPWGPIFDHFVGLISGHPANDVSLADYQAGEEEGGDFPVALGLGRLIETIAGDLPVTCNCTVEAIDTSGPRVKVSTSHGTLEARVVILTVPTAVLVSGGVQFTPALPAATQEALHALPLGTHEKVVFRLDAPLPGQNREPAATVFDRTQADTLNALSETRRGLTQDAINQPITVNLSPFGDPLLVAHIGGSHAGQLVQAGPDAMIDAARTASIQAFGSEIAAKITGATTTSWRADPWSQGCYSTARPGAMRARKTLREPIAGRLFIAGEATHSEHYASAHGAHMEGQRAAAAAIGAL